MLEAVFLGAMYGLLAGEWLVIMWLGLELTGSMEAVRSALRWRARRVRHASAPLSHELLDRVAAGVPSFRAAGLTVEEAEQALKRFGEALRKSAS